MADKNAVHPDKSQLHYPDGSVYVYAKASQELTKGQYVEVNPLGNVAKFKGGLVFPKGIAMEFVPRDHFSWFMVQEPAPQVDKPGKKMISPEAFKQAIDSKVD